METIKQFIATLGSKIQKAIDEGNVVKANEITANMMLGAVLIIMTFLTISCGVLNEFGIFSVDKVIMRWTVFLSLLVEIPIIIYNQAIHGESRIMKYLLCWGILAICEMQVCTLGHNVTLIMAVPIVVSLRYCDAKFTRTIVIASLILFTVAHVGNAFIGIINLNVYHPEVGSTITITSSLREAIMENYDKNLYLKSLFINDYLPKMMAFSVLGFSCIKIAKRGREMVDIQNVVSQKTSRLETELNLATEIQASMLPCIFPAFPSHGELELYAKNDPAKEVGGDFYDYFTIDDDHIAVVMADVSGKGVGAALFMTIGKIVIKNQLQATLDPAKALANANNQLCENNTAGLFITAWAGIYQISTGVMTFANAGHNPPIVHLANKPCEYLYSKRGFVLAGLEDAKYTNCTIQLRPIDELFLYTDGVTEAQNENQELFGEVRLLELMNKEIDKPVKQQVDDIFMELNNFMGKADQFDDITMLGIKVKDNLNA